MTWIKKYWKIIVATAVSVLALVLVFLLYIFKKKQEAEKLQAELFMFRAGAKVSGLEAEKTAKQKALKLTEEKAKELDTKMTEISRVALAKIKEVDTLSDEAVLAEFKELGY